MKKTPKLKLLLLEQFSSLREASKVLDIPYTRLSVLVNDWEAPNEEEGEKINQVVLQDDSAERKDSEMTDHGIENNYSQGYFADVLDIYQDPKKKPIELYQKLVKNGCLPDKGIEFFEDALLSLAEWHLVRMGVVEINFIYREDASHRLHMLSYISRIIGEVRDFNEYSSEEVPNE